MAARIYEESLPYEIWTLSAISLACWEYFVTDLHDLQLIKVLVLAFLSIMEIFLNIFFLNLYKNQWKEHKFWWQKNQKKYILQEQNNK